MSIRPTPGTDQQLLTVKEVATLLRVSKAHLPKLMHEMQKKVRQ
jgi:DNA-binding IscR family transcriptional regulator